MEDSLPRDYATLKMQRIFLRTAELFPLAKAAGLMSKESAKRL